MTASHSEVGVQLRETRLGVRIRNNAKRVRHVKNVVIKRESTSGNKVNTLLLDGGISVQTLLLGNLEELLGRDLVAPVGFQSLLHLTLRTNTGETENGRRTSKVSIH